MAQQARIGSIDFWRGGILLAILVDHIPGNWLENLTPRNFGLSDCAEAFVFLSGLSVGAIYMPRAQKQGIGAVFSACLRRAGRLYSVHIALTIVALLIFGVAGRLTGIDAFLAEHGRSLVFQEPRSAAAGIAVLSHQIGYFNILPMYIVLMIWAPFVVVMALSSPRLALGMSALLYLLTRVFDLNLPNWPQPGGWFFNPLAWQLMFTMGVVTSIRQKTEPIRPARPLLIFFGLLLAGSVIFATSGAGLVPNVRSAFEIYLDLGKQNLGLARLIHFLALAYVVAATPALARLAGGRIGQRLQMLGRHSLPVFAAGSLLSALGQTLLTIAAVHANSGVVGPLGMAYTLACIGFLFFLARRLDCKARPKPTDTVAEAPRWRFSGPFAPTLGA